MNRDLINRLADEFDALDVSAESARIAEVQAEIERAEAAIAKAEARCTEIARRIVDYRGPNGRQVGDALLADPDAGTAAKAGEQIADLEAERTSLRAGITDLRRRVQDWSSEIDEAKHAALGQAARLAQPLVDAITADAKRAAEQVIECYAALSALSLGVRVGSIAEGQLRYAADGIMGQGRLLSWRERLPGPDEIGDLLDRLSAKGDALLVRRASSVPSPYIEERAILIAAAAARR